jgi:hypothetical protein
VVEVERRRVVDELGILPVLHQADENGHLDGGAVMWRAQKRADLPGGSTRATQARRSISSRLMPTPSDGRRTCS